MEARGKPAGPRARGRPPQGAMQRQGPPPAAFQTAPQPQQPAWGARGRGGGGTESRGQQQAAPQQQRQQQPVAQPTPVQAATQQLQSMSIGAGDASSRGAATKAKETTRGGMRQRPLDFVYRNPELSSKQGTAGKKVMLKANYFPFVTKADMALYQYRVDFQPDEERTGVRKGLLKSQKEALGQAYVFDGTVLFTRQRLGDSLELTTKKNQDDQIVRILIKKTVDLLPSDPNYVDFMNNILRTCFSQMGMKLIRRNYYDFKSVKEVAEFQLEIWPGFESSIRQCESKILMNVDLSFKVMRQETAYQLLEDCKARGGSNYKDIFLEAVLRTVVITRHNNITYEIDDVDFESTPNSTFECKGEKISFKDYYKKKYQINIRYDNQPLLVSRAKVKRDQNREAKINLLVPELCFLTGITDSMRANFKLMQEIAKHTRVAPGERIRKLEDGFMRNLSTNCTAELNAWNMSFDRQLVQFQGRTLPPEIITLGRDTTIRVDEATGDFTKSLTSKGSQGLFNPGVLSSWAVIYPSKISADQVRIFCETLSRASRTLNFNIPQPMWEPLANDKVQSYTTAIEKCVNNKATLIMCIVLNTRADRYEAIKKKCYINRPVPNQVVVAKNVSRANMSVATKIAIQMSVKLGGAPWCSKIPFKAPVMIVGFDVGHAGRSKGASFGALVASLDGNFTRYFSCLQLHSEKEELSNYIGPMMLKAMMIFRKHNKRYPEKIIFYRDGIGEGNIRYCLEQEVSQIKIALQPCYENATVPLTFIIVSKRVNTRIFMNQGNPPPGTVVDSEITRPTQYDFFLISQSVGQGTVSPTSYNVIYDAVNLKPDIVQQLSYKLCHMYYNWSGTIRVPAPCQYAHKLAFLAGQYLHQAPPAGGMDEILYFL